MRNYHTYHIETGGRTSGKIKTFCPQCHELRRNKRDKSLSVDLNQGLCHCHHCGWSLHVPDQAQERARQQRQTRPSAPPQHFHRPTFDPTKLTLSEPTTRYLVETRCIPQTVIEQLQLAEQYEFMPQSGQKERCLCFHYFEEGVLVNTKYRSGQKHFKMVAGAELIPYHIDGAKGTPQLIITEGELDAASFLAIGRTDVVSVPAGANANLAWMDRFAQSHFEEKKLIYIAVDTDGAGGKLRDELLRRLGAERCRIVSYGPGCKDANEHLVRYGADSLRIALQQAQEVPLEGIFTAADLSTELRALYENGFGPGAETGWANFDSLCTLELQRLMVVTGKPGSGKSEWVDELVLRLCLRHDWRVAFFSPENVPIVYHLRKLAEKLTSYRFALASRGMSEPLYNRLCSYLTQHLCHIQAEESFDIDSVLEQGRQLVVRRGIRILVIDPLNRLDQNMAPGQTETQYLSRLLNKLSHFATRNHCLVILVAHPRKMYRNTLTGITPRVEMYDINGSADFYNKADFGIVVERDDEVKVVRVHVDKVKFKHLGQPGTAHFAYDMISGRYFPCQEDTNPATPVEQRTHNIQFDNQPWLPSAEAEAEAQSFAHSFAQAEAEAESFAQSFAQSSAESQSESQSFAQSESQSQQGQLFEPMAPPAPQ